MTYTAATLITLSVAAMEEALAETGATEAVLREALALENAKKEPRKTAVELLEDALDAYPEDVLVDPGYYVADGRSITTKIGIRVGGQQVDPDMVTGGEKTLDHLVDRGHCVKVI